MSRIAIPLLILAACAALLGQYRKQERLAAQLKQVEQELAELKSENSGLEEKFSQTEKERERFQKDATEVHRLRGEIATLRTTNKTLEQQAAHATRAAEAARAAAAAAAAVPPTPDAGAGGVAPSGAGAYAEVGKFVGELRNKVLSGAPLTPAEREYLQKLRPELVKLERSPAEFASFQAQMIETTAGISDPTKTEKIRQAIQLVYENAVAQGLDLPSRQGNDPKWIEERSRLNQRGTQAVSEILSEQERALFGRQFRGIMGPNLGFGAGDQSNPRGALSDAQ